MNRELAALIRAAACAHALSTTRIHSEQCLLVYFLDWLIQFIAYV